MQETLSHEYFPTGEGMKKLSNKEKFDRGTKALAMLLGITVRAILEKYGPEGLKCMEDAWREAHSVWGGEKMAKIVGVKENEKNINGVAKCMDFASEIYGETYRWMEKSSIRGIKRHTSCRLYQFYPPELCHTLHRAAIEGIGIGLTGNPNFKCSVTSCISAGDQYCDFIIDDAR
jgi:predicted hydrocarbon binding protein